MTQAITPQTAIGEIIEICPDAAKILLTYGVHCVGCHVSPFESLEDGFRGHGLGQAEIVEAVGKVNAQIAKDSSNNSKTDSNELINTKLKLTVSDKAAIKLKQLCNDHQKYALRIKVLPGGCSGYKYGLDLINESDSKELNSQEIIDKGVKIVINLESLEKIAGAELDYSDSLQGAGFKIINPNAKRTCGCGESFR
jgi:iron-sulfur cluster assembly protein